MELVGIRVELPENAPIALLRETGGAHRVLQIYIGGTEATAIAYATEGVAPPRPLTHDLMKDLLDGIGVRVDKVVVTELRDHIFFAEIELTNGNGVTRVSSRPSDAIALAVRTGSRIFASEEVLEAAAMPGEGESPEELVDEFREFIEGVSPEDFAS